MSRLAEVYDQRLSSLEIAKKRRLPQTLVAKVLTQLSQAGLVSGAPGPGGGYTLTKPPGKISLFDIARVFEGEGRRIRCPFGPDWCGTKDPCPLHDQLCALDERANDFLKNTRLDVFAPRPPTRKRRRRT